MIDLRDGLSFEELLELAKAVNVSKLLSQPLHNDLDGGVNSMLSLLSTLQSVPWLLRFLPGNIAAQIDGSVRMLTLMKGLLEV